MSDAIEMDVYGLKCDAAGCGWSDMSITRAQYPEYRNNACPDCGSNVLTDADWNMLLAMETAAKFVNKYADILGVEDDEPAREYAVNLNGTGKFTLTPKAPQPTTPAKGGGETP